MALRTDIERIVAASDGIINVRHRAYDAPADGIADATAEIQAALDAMATDGSTVFFPPGKYLISSPLIVRKKGAVLWGGAGPAVDLYDNSNYHTQITVGAGWSTTAGMIRTEFPVPSPTRGTANNDAEACGGLTVVGIMLRAGTGTANGGYGIHVRKESGDNTFWGNITLDRVNILNGNSGVYFDANGSSEGFGWVDVRNSRIGACNYGIYSNKFVNVFRVRNSQVWQNKLAATGNYHTRTGGGIYLPGGRGIIIEGNDLEGSQVGVHLEQCLDVTLRGNYLEAMYDGAFTLIACNDVDISGNNSNGGISTHVYCYNSRSVTCRNNGYFSDTGQDYRMRLIVAPHCRDLVTDTPELTRYSVDETGSQTLGDKGFCLRGPAVQLPQVSNREAVVLAASISTNNATITEAWSGIRGPAGQVSKLTRSTASANYGYVQFNYPSTQLETNETAILSAWIRVDETNSGTSGNFVYVALLEGGGIIWEGTIEDTRIAENEWVQIRFVHKETAGAARTYALRIATVKSGDFLDIADPAMIVMPHGGYDLDGGEAVGATQRFLRIGDRWFGSAVPSDSTQTWADGDVIYNVDAVSAGNIGWVCTTAGDGASATFKTWGVIA